MSDNDSTSTISDLSSSSVSHQASAYRGGFAVVPDGYSLVSVEDFQDDPNRIKTNLVFRDFKSLSSYLKRFSLQDALAMASPGQKEILVTIDHHADGKPSHCGHKAKLSAVLASPYSSWREVNGKPLSQTEAGLFLEERAIDVKKPDAASIMEIVMNFDALKKVTFKSRRKLHDGSIQFEYNEENEQRGNVTLPESIEILSPVYEGQEPQVIQIRVRYRIEDGRLRFSFEVHDIAEVERIAFEKLRDAFQVEMGGDFEVLNVI